MRKLITNGTGDERPAIAFYHESESRLQTGEEVCQRKTARKQKHRESQIGTAGAESTDKVDHNQSIMQGEEKSLQSEKKIENTEEKNTLDEQKNPECFPQSGTGDGSSSQEQMDDHPSKEPGEAAAASDTTARASQDVPDLSDMLEFPLSSPGGACVVSLSLMTLGLLSVHVSIPKQIVVVDSSLVDNDVVKR